MSADDDTILEFHYRHSLSLFQSPYLLYSGSHFSSVCKIFFELIWDFSNQFYSILAKHTYSNYSQIVEMSTKDVKCELCDMTFATQQEKEEHKKLEHKEHREPSGVS